jgi:predicted PurR-regulated permease PerM
MTVQMNERQRRWLDALLILATIAVGFVVLGFVASVFFEFGDTILIFFLAWLLAFILSPLVAWLTRIVPVLPRIGAVIVVYALLLGALIAMSVLVAGALSTSIIDFVASVPTLRDRLPEILAPWQGRLDSLGFEQVDLTGQAEIFLANINQYAVDLRGPLEQIAVASLGAIGSLVLILILSLYIVIDRDRILSFLFRVVPPGFKDQARLLETSVARSFGGFLRGQALMGIVYAAVAVLASAALQLPYLPITSALAGLLMAIPFFGPFVAWAPPVLAAVFFVPEATIPAIIVMGVGWFIVMNILQPRLMEETVGIHPIVVLGSVLIGSKIAGVAGAIFGIPIAAILSAFFFYYLGQSRDTGPVAARAARRLAEREGRRVRIPREPEPGADADVDVAEPRASDAPATPPVPAPAAASATEPRPVAPPRQPGSLGPLPSRSVVGRASQPGTSPTDPAADAAR